MDIKLSTDWILSNMCFSIYCENDDAIVICDLDDYKWVKLAFDTLGIDYTEDEYFDELDEDFETPEYHFAFNINDIKDSSPDFYTELLVLSLRNNPNYVQTNKKTHTFQECENFESVISSDNLGILANHICVAELAKDIDGFIEYDGILYLNVDGGFIRIKRKIN
jgi:hypothetical protein